MAMRTAFSLVFVACLVGGCADGRTTIPASTTQPTIRSRATWRGVAENHKVGAFLRGPGVYVELPDKYWPSEAEGRTVEVQGILVERHDLPVFIADPNEPAIAGIPVPPGTDLHEASKRLIVEEAKWKAVADGG